MPAVFCDERNTINPCEMARYTCRYPSPLGGLLLASDGTALTGVWFEGQRYYAEALPAHREDGTLPVFEETRAWLDLYFRHREPDFMPPVRLEGSPFRLAVWELLRKIPYGRTVTYRDLALRLARQRGMRRMAAQAVGGAVAHNPVSIIVPCHRVVGVRGNLTGYAGGIGRKVMLLKTEGADTSGFFMPGRGAMP